MVVYYEGRQSKRNRALPTKKATDLVEKSNQLLLHCSHDVVLWDRVRSNYDVGIIRLREKNVAKAIAKELISTEYNF